jgi:hypothetical protein
MDSLTDKRYKCLKKKCDNKLISEEDCERLNRGLIKYLENPNKNELEWVRLVDELSKKYRCK